MKSIKELSTELGVSTTAIYKKLKNDKRDFQPYLKKVSNTKYLEREGIELLKTKFVQTKNDESLKLNEEQVLNRLLNESETNGSKGFQTSLKLQEKHIKTLQAELEHSKKQLEVKDKQIEKKDKQIDKLQDQSQNYQELLLVKEKQIMQLKEPKVENEIVDQEEEKSGWFKGWFGK